MSDMRDCEIKEFRFLSTDDLSNSKWNNWSRNYEYEWIAARIKTGRIHNTACGGVFDTHYLFSGYLQQLPGCTVINSDIIFSDNIPDIEIYNLLTPYPISNYFDSVLIISTLEHIIKSCANMKSTVEAIFDNALDSLKMEGKLLVTFDSYSSETKFNYKLLEGVVGVELIHPDTPLKQSDVTVGVLEIIKKGDENGKRFHSRNN